MILLKQMIVLAIMMGIGYFLAKKDILDPKTSKKLSWIVVNICNPALMISAALAENTLPKETLLKSVYVAGGFYLILLVLGFFLPYILKDKTNKVYSMMLVFGNVGFMGYPVLASMYGPEAVLIASIFNIYYGVLIYTYGIMIISGKKFEVKNLKMLFNSGIVAAVIEIIIFVTGIKLPEFMTKSFDMVADLTAPVSMMIIGATFVGLSLKKLIKDWRIMVFSLIRMIIVPIALFPLFKLCSEDEMFIGVCLVMAAVPVGSMNVMLANQYGGNTETSSKGVAFTTLISVVTMPLLFMLLMP